MLPKSVWCGVVFALSLTLPGRSEMCSDTFQSALIRAEVNAHIARLEEEVSELRLALLTRAPAFRDFARRSLFAPGAEEGKETASADRQLGLFPRTYVPAFHGEPQPSGPKLRLTGSLFFVPDPSPYRWECIFEYADFSMNHQP